MGHILDGISFGAIVAVRDRLLAMQANGRKIYRLESGDPDFAVSKEVKEAMKLALDFDHTHYTASAGIIQLRKAIVTKVSTENLIPIDDPEKVVVTSGGMHALFLTFAAMLDSGDEVIIPDPMWTEIAENIRLAGGVAVRCEMDLMRSDSYTASMIEQKITSKTKAIFLNTPHNPTGHVIPNDELQRILDLAIKHDLKIISDEAYEHIIFDGLKHCSIASFNGALDRTVSLFSASKSYAMSGLRIGYIVATDMTFLDRVKKLLRCSTNGVNSISQWGAATAMRVNADYSELMRSQYQKRRDLLIDGLSDRKSLTLYKPSGAFFLWAKINGDSDDVQFTNRLIDATGVGSSPGSAFGPSGSGHVRFAFSCGIDQIAEAIDALRSIVS
jgi:aspartate aminotransferase